MAKRFTSTEIWGEDWFLEMPNNYKLFWYYMLSHCDHAGMFRVNLNMFCKLTETKVFSDEIIGYFNKGKDRIRVLTPSVWYIEDFFVFQYGNIFNPNNKLHESISKIYNKYNINVLEIRGLKEVKEKSLKGKEVDFDTLKDKVKDKDILEDTKEIFFDKNSLTPKMVEVFKQYYPYYPVDEKSDFQSCLQIAYLIAKQKKWTKDSVLAENMGNVLDAWDKIVQFSTTDKWYSTRSISDFCREFQRIVQSMTAAIKPKTFQKQDENKSTAPPLTRL